MSLEHLLALAAFALATSITPGPNNLMLLASGANFGVRRTVPHMVGISLGHMVMTIAVGAGLMKALQATPQAFDVLRWVSVAFILFLAWKIASAAPASDATSRARPLTFLQAAAFQWANPKAWMMSLGAIGAYAPDHTLEAVALVALIFSAVNLPSVGVWTVLGTQLRRLLNTRKKLRAFNIGSALLLLASMIPLLRDV